MDILAALTAEFHLRPQQVENTVRLIDDGNTIPFIARYRKEMTGSLDDQVLREAWMSSGRRCAPPSKNKGR